MVIREDGYMDILELKDSIEKRRLNRLQSKCTVYPKNNPTASSLEECTRKMSLEMMYWKDKPVFEPEVMARLEEGNRQESYVIRELMELGFTITENNPAPFEILSRDKNKIILRGKIDGKFEIERKKIPFEVKSMNANIFSRIESIEDFNKFFWTKKYLLQMQSYLYANNEEYGLFICTDMQGHWKIFPIKLDYELMESILIKCEEAVEGRDSRNLSDFCKDSSICRRCWLFKKHCHPPLDFGEGVQIIEDDELQVDLNRRDELMLSASEYESLDKKIKERFKPRLGLQAIVGNFEINVKESTVKMKATEAREIKKVTVKIEKIESDVTVETS